MPPACDSTRPACDDAGLRYDAGPAPGPDPYQPKPRKTHVMNRFKLELKDKTVPQKLAWAAPTSPRWPRPGRSRPTRWPTASRPTPNSRRCRMPSPPAETSVDEKEQAWKLAIVERDAAEAAWDTGITARANYCESVDAERPRRPGEHRPAPALRPDADRGPADAGEPAGEGVGLRRPDRSNLRCRDRGEDLRMAIPPPHRGSAWQSVQSTTGRKTSVTGLTPGAQYAFRVRALGSAGPSPWSDEAGAARGVNSGLTPSHKGTKNPFPFVA